MIAPVATGVIAGLGGHGYPLAVAAVVRLLAVTPAAAWTSPGGSTGCARRLDDAGCDALLVTHLTNIRYLTGFTGSAAVLLVQPDALTFVTDGRYEEQAAGQLAAAGVDGRHRDRPHPRRASRSSSPSAPPAPAASASRPST